MQLQVSSLGEALLEQVFELFDTHRMLGDWYVLWTKIGREVTKAAARLQSTVAKHLQLAVPPMSQRISAQPTAVRGPLSMSHASVIR